MSQFESVIKSVMENYKAPMENGAWSEFDQKLNPNKKSSFFSQFVVAGVVLTTSLVVLNDGADHNTAADHAIVHTQEYIADNHVGNATEEDSFVISDKSTEEFVDIKEKEAIESDKSPENNTVTTNSTNSTIAIADIKENLSSKEKESIIEINNAIKEKVEKTPVTEYVGKDFNLNANMLLTPNGDGLHDYFLPDAISEGDDFLMKIFDAKNVLIFSTSDVESPWTGYNQNTDALAEPGKYRWKVILATENRKEIFNGSIRVE